MMRGSPAKSRWRWQPGSKRKRARLLPRPFQARINNRFRSGSGSRDDRHAFDRDAIDRCALFAAATGLGRNVGDFFKNVVAFHQFTEGGVLAIEETRIAVDDEKLAAGAVGTLRASHR